ncbi:MAG TPA: ribonuclease HI family protein [Candidatus Binatia bacterium]|jgi:ribonuclease HI
MADAPAGEWLLMVDGASRGNPGEAGCGAVIFNPEGEPVRELSRYLGKATNNVAEYAGLLMGLEEAIKLGVKQLRVESDSELLVRQLTGVYKVKEPRLIELHRKAQELLLRFESHRIRHVYREQNRIADKLANRGIDEARGKN